MQRRLSGEFYYLGCFNAHGDRISLKEIRAEFRAGFDVTAVDINPACYSKPYRVLLAASPFEADEVLRDHCQKHPGGRIARMFLMEVDDDAEEYVPFIIRHNNKKLAPAEDWLLAVEQVKDAALLVTEAGGECRRLARRLAPGYDLELSWENGNAWVYGWAPPYNRPNGVAEMSFPAAPKDLAPALQAAKAWELAWRQLAGAAEIAAHKNA
jgi:hypothetical protein